MRRKALFLLCFLTLMVGAIGDAWAKRVALVIANSDYEHTEKLSNPPNDARALAEAFKRLNFDSVTLKENLDYRNMRLALKDFANESAGAELALVYFAGHGIEVSGQNYLIPTDARLETATDVDFEGIPLPSVLSSVEGADNLKLVILDACRNNPFRARMIRRSGTRSIGRGLAKVEPESNTLVAFAAKEGTVALDGDDKHSPYANALLQVVEEAGVEVGFLFRRVRDMVLQATGQRQEPYTYGSLGGTPIYLKDPEKEVADEKEKAESDDRIANLRKELDELKKQFNQSNMPSEKVGETVVANAEPATRENTSSAKTDSTESKGPGTQDEFAAPPPGSDGSQKVASAQPEPAPQEQEKDASTQQEADGQSPELALDIQKELARLGCDPGRPDGIWGLRTSTAMSNLNKESNQQLSTSRAEQDTLDALRAMSGPVCKAPVQVVKPTPAQPKPKVAKQQQNAPKKSDAAAQKKPNKDPDNNFWGGTDTRIECERAFTADCFPDKR